MKLRIEGGSISGNQNVGIFLDGVDEADLIGVRVDRNRGGGIIARSTPTIPDDLAKPIRDAVAEGQTPQQIGSAYGELLAKYGVPLAVLAAAADGAQLLQSLGLT